jgi:hypothetical protein
MFRLLQQQRYPWAPGSFVVTVALLAVLGRLLPAPDNSGHFSGGILSLELGIIALGIASVVATLALIRQPPISPLPRAAARFTRARLAQAIGRAAVPLGVGIALICQSTGRSLVQTDSGAAPNATGVALLLIAQICFFGGFALGVLVRPFSLARVTRPTPRMLLWLLVIVEWIALFIAAILANGLGQQGKHTIVQDIPSLLFIDATSLALIGGSVLLFRHTLALAERDAGGPIVHSDWPRIFWDAGSAKISLYGLALAILGLGALPSLSSSDPLWIGELCACLVVAIFAAIAPAPAALPSSAASNGTASMAGNA